MRTAAVWTSVILDTAFHGHDTNQAAYDQLHAAGVDKWAPNDVIYHQLSGGLTLEARVMGDGSGRWEMRVDRWRRPITRRPGRDRSQAWRYRNHKMRHDAVVPIDDELTTMIEAQQVRARQRFPDTAVLLPRGHANPDGRFPIHTGTFDMRLKRWLADAVTDELGRPVKVTPHQFRHTATRLINNDVPLEVVRRLLDHTSHTMTARYARLADTTIREQWERAQKINIRGEPIDTSTDGPLADAAWMKQNLSRAKMALPNGYCGLPLQKSCPHANALPDLP